MKEDLLVNSIAKYLLSAQKHHDKNSYHGKSSQILRSETKDLIAYRFSYGTQAACPLEDFKEDLAKYLYHGGKQMVVPQFNKATINHYVKFLIKQQPAMLEKILTMHTRAHSDQSPSCHQQAVYLRSIGHFLEVAAKTVQETGHDSYAKQIASILLKNIQPIHLQINTSSAFVYLREINNTLQILENFKWQEAELPLIHHLLKTFNITQDLLENNIDLKQSLTGFLKTSVAFGHWPQFNHYFGQDNASPSRQDLSLENAFSSLGQPSRELIIDKAEIVSRYSVVSLGQDYVNMLTRLVQALKNQRATLGLCRVHLLNLSENPDYDKSALYVVAMDEKPIDQQKLKKVFLSMMQSYMQILQTSQYVEDTQVYCLFQHALLQSTLEEKSSGTAKHKL